MLATFTTPLLPLLLPLCWCDAGVAPTAAMRLLQQLQLFPVVFSPPPELQQLLGTGYGAQCVEVVAAAEKLVGALEMQVRGSTYLLYCNLATINCNYCITTSPPPQLLLNVIRIVGIWVGLCLLHNQQLGTGHGAPCVEVVVAAEQLVGAL
jgi:hypothetical protein